MEFFPTIDLFHKRSHFQGDLQLSVRLVRAVACPVSFRQGQLTYSLSEVFVSSPSGKLKGGIVSPLPSSTPQVPIVSSGRGNTAPHCCLPQPVEVTCL